MQRVHDVNIDQMKQKVSNKNEIYRVCRASENIQLHEVDLVGCIEYGIAHNI